MYYKAKSKKLPLKEYEEILNYNQYYKISHVSDLFCLLAVYPLE